MKFNIFLIASFVFFAQHSFSQKLITEIKYNSKIGPEFYIDVNNNIYVAEPKKSLSKFSSSGNLIYELGVKKEFVMLISPDGKSVCYTDTWGFKSKKSDAFLFELDEKGQELSINLKKVFDLIDNAEIQNIALDNDNMYFLVYTLSKTKKIYSLIKMNLESKEISLVKKDFCSLDYNDIYTKAYSNDLIYVGETHDNILYTVITYENKKVNYSFFNFSKLTGGLESFTKDIDTKEHLPLYYDKSRSLARKLTSYRYTKNTYSKSDHSILKQSEIGNVSMDQSGKVVITGFTYNNNGMNDLREFYYMGFNINKIEETPDVKYTTIVKENNVEEHIMGPRIPDVVLIRKDLYYLEYAYNVNMKLNYYSVNGVLKDGKLEDFTYINGSDDSYNGIGKNSKRDERYKSLASQGLSDDFGSNEYFSTWNQVSCMDNNIIFTSGKGYYKFYQLK